MRFGADRRLPSYMVRKKLRQLLPTPQSVQDIKILRIFGNSLINPRLWCLNRRSVSAGVAVGLLCGLIPGPFQMLGAGICAVAFKTNLPVALFVTLYTNPLTIVPLYFVGYRIGTWLTGQQVNGLVNPPPDWQWQAVGTSMQAMSDWMVSLGTPLLIGVPALGCILAVIGYCVVRTLWSASIRWQAMQRRRRRA